jgi:hypothetical protein
MKFIPMRGPLSTGCAHDGFLDRTVRQSSIGAMGFKRRKLEDQRREVTEKEAANLRV